MKARDASIGLIAAAAFALGGCRGWDSDKPPVHLNWNMDTQEKGKAYRKNDTFADGRMMRTPPAGTVARGQLKDDVELWTGVGADGQPLDTKTLPASYPSDATVVARGKDRYMVYCAPCHGLDADGKGPVSQPGRLLVPAPSFLDPRLISMPTGQIYKAIAQGVNNDNMPSYAAQLPVSDRWAIVSYLCMLQGGKDPKAPCADRKPPKPPWKGDDSEVNAERGESVYAYKGGCNACHTTDGSPKIGPSFKGLYGKTEATNGGDVTVDDAYIIESIQNPNAKLVNGFAPVMPPRADLSENELKSLIEFIKTLK